MERLILDGHKLNWHRDRVEAWLAGERIAPVTIDCSLTRSCSYRCSYCYGQLQENDSRPMTKDVIFRFLDDAAEIGVKGISFVSDGESTCSPYLYDALERGMANGLDMAIGTNGFLLEDDRLEDILPSLTYLRFNISAGEPLRYAEIHGCGEDAFHKVVATIRKAVAIKRRKGLNVTIGLQMVLLPAFRDQLVLLARLGADLGVDYLVIKHCSDDENGTLGVDYGAYHDLVDELKEAEAFSSASYQVSVKWSKLLSDGKRSYNCCYGPPFILQLSGSGLVAPCGMLFNSRHSRYHIGNIVETSFKELWQGERYWDVMRQLESDTFDVHTTCGSLCLQHKVNEFLEELKHGVGSIADEPGIMPMHVNFI
ncbi:MAG: radical SAM protein [Deltaproteobacteria bacterium]|nr:radical SAM protein [Deltaproteobacteria bacterium]